MVLRSRPTARLGTSCARSIASRNFSNSTPWRRRGTLAAFPSTSNRELDAIIARFRETAFLPNHLNKAYRKMIYRPTEHFYLTGEEPVKVTVPLRLVYPGQELPQPPPREKPARPAATDGKARDPSRIPRAKAPHVHGQKKPRAPRETFTLSPLQINSDIPNTRSNYLRMLQLMQTSSDFQIVPAFLQELQTANLPVTPAMLAKTARKSAELDRVDIVINMFQGVHQVGLQINHPDIVQQVMLAIVRQAAAGYWTERRLDRALNFADSVLIMLRDPRHQIESKPKEPSVDMGTQPYPYGTAVALSAVQALRYGASSPTPHRTHTLYTLATSFLERLDMASLPESNPSWVKQNEWLATWAPSIVGARYAVQALGEKDPVGMKLQLALPALEETLANAVQVVKDAPEGKNMRLGLRILGDMEAALTAEAPPEAPKEDPVFVGSDEVVEGEETLEELFKEEGEKDKA